MYLTLYLLYLIMVLNVVSVSSFPEPLGLIEVTQVLPQVGVVHYSLLVALQWQGRVHNNHTRTKSWLILY